MSTSDAEREKKINIFISINYKTSDNSAGSSLYENFLLANFLLLYTKHENQPQYFRNQIILNINSFVRFASLLTEHFDIFPCYLQAPFFNLHFIYRLPCSISMLFTGSLFWFPSYLQAPFFDFHAIYRLPFLISMLFIGSLFRFTHYLQAPFLQFTCYLQPFYSMYM